MLRDGPTGVRESRYKPYWLASIIGSRKKAGMELLREFVLRSRSDAAEGKLVVIDRSGVDPFSQESIGSAQSSQRTGAQNLA